MSRDETRRNLSDSASYLPKWAEDDERYRYGPLELPKGVKPDGLPSELTQQVLQLADYGYSKMEDKILLVNEMMGKIADIIPEAQPQTTRK